MSNLRDHVQPVSSASLGRAKAAAAQYIAAKPGAAKGQNAAHGQVRPINDRFEVGGESLFLPSDSGASLAETANCRCTVRYFAQQAGVPPPVLAPLPPPARIVQQVSSPRNLGRINLLEHEGRGIPPSHTIAKHVGKSEAQLRRFMQPTPGLWTMRYRIRHSSFTSLSAANALVSATLAKGIETEPGEFYLEFRQPTGVSLVRREILPISRPQGRLRLEKAYGVLVVVRADKSMVGGWRIHTAYPTVPVKFEKGVPMTSKMPSVWRHFMLCEAGFTDAIGSIEAALLAFKTEMTETEKTQLQDYLNYMGSLSEAECLLQSRPTDLVGAAHFPTFVPCSSAFQHFRDVFSGKITGPF